MRRILLLHLVLTLTFASASRAETNDAAAIEARLKKDITVLADDERDGRGLGTDGLEEAAEYIAAEFNRLGLKTDLFDGTPFQKFNVTLQSQLDSEGENWLSLYSPSEDGAVEKIAPGDSATPLAIGGSGKAEADLVFVGYGITAEDIGYDDYAGSDVEGKIVVLIRKEPQQRDKDSKFNGTRSSQHAFFSTKIANAAKHGAAGLIMINDGLTVQAAKQAAVAAEKKAVDALVEAGLKHAEAVEKGEKPDAQAFAEQVDKLAKQVKSVRDMLEGDFDRVIPFTGAGDDDRHPNLPVYFVKRSLIAPIVKTTLGKTLEELEAAIDEKLEPQSAPLGEYRATLQTAIERREVEVKNVIASLEGEGPHADETIVIGAHYDHLGLGGRGSLAPWTKEIHNGADDNASGTTAMLEIARHFASQEKKPSRRLVFMAFTGEERGLLGSAHYARNPRFALEDTIAMYNLDMVGRLTDDKIKIQGTGTAAEFDSLVDKLNEKYGFKIEKDPSGIGPSDHASFYRQKVPVLHLFTYLHNDYHRPSDDVEKINFEGMRRVVQMTEEIVQWTLDQSERPEYKEVARGRRRGR